MIIERDSGFYRNVGSKDGTYRVLRQEARGARWEEIGSVARATGGWSPNGDPEPTRTKGAAVLVCIEQHECGGSPEPDQPTSEPPKDRARFWGQDFEVECDPELDDFTVDPAYGDGRGALANWRNGAQR